MKTKEDKKKYQHEWYIKNKKHSLEYAKEYRETHRDEIREYARKNREYRLEVGKRYRTEHRAELREKSKQYCENNRGKILRTQKDRKAEAKRLVLSHYSGGTPKCACCRETEVKFLTINHNNGGGSAHRRSLGGGAAAVYLWLVRNKFPDGFSVLCYNCNCASWYNKGICPHKEVKGEIDVDHTE